MSEREFVFSASMDLRWFPPKDSQKLLDVATSRGIVSLEDGLVSPSFDVSKVDIPLGFTPSSAVLELPPEEDLFSKILEYMLTHLDRERKDVISRINAIQERMGVEIEIAALLAGEEQGLDMSKFFKDVEEIILERGKSAG